VTRGAPPAAGVRLLRHVLPAAAAIVLAFSVAACGRREPPGTKEGGMAATVEIKGVAFKPPRVAVNQGGTVTWTWLDGTVQHDVAGEGFKSPLMSAGTFTHTFPQPGAVEYTCTVHPTVMKGLVEVKRPPGR
jgi:plastocyanin